jgi:hypothetical protein
VDVVRAGPGWLPDSRVAPTDASVVAGMAVSDVGDAMIDGENEGVGVALADGYELPDRICVRSGPRRTLTTGHVPAAITATKAAAPTDHRRMNRGEPISSTADPLVRQAATSRDEEPIACGGAFASRTSPCSRMTTVCSSPRPDQGRRSWPALWSPSVAVYRAPM